MCLNRIINKLLVTSIRSTAKHMVIGAAVLTISACQSGGSTGDTALGTDCSADSQKQWAYDAMLDYYVFYDQVPVVDPLVFDSANDVVRSVRFEERDPFSNVSDAAQSSLLFDEGSSFGLGYGLIRDDEDQPRVALVYANSPFGLAGIERGDIVVSVDGIDWDDEQLNTNWRERVIGTPDNPSTASWRFSRRDTGEQVDVDITAALYNINSVLEYNTYSIDTLPNKVGYLSFNVFLDTSVDELNDAFALFASENIGELIVDLRYNGGGRVSVAQHLASLIGNSTLGGSTLYEYRYNDKYSAANRGLQFLSNVGTLNLNRVVILTTGRTASSSEIVIAGLQPYLDVVTIGSTSSGKPYISGPFDRCGERLNIMEAEGFNANDISVFGGIAATCYAEDDLTQDFGLSDSGDFEGFLDAGIDYLQNAQCTTAPTTFEDEPQVLPVSIDFIDARTDSLVTVNEMDF